MEPQADPQTEQSPPAADLRAFVQLFRLPNVFTAIADVTMGYLFVRPTLEPPQYSVPLILGSALMYISGMVLNDVYDVERDRVERPERPLPSGRIDVAWARWLGYEMLFIGAALGVAAGVMRGDPRPAVVAVGLAALIVLYNRVLKATFVGPIVMGGCRFLNVLFGMSAAVGAWTGIHYLIAAAIGLYIVGVSWFARGEADEDIHRGPLVAGSILIGAGMLLLAWFPHSHWIDPSQLVPILQQNPKNWSLAWILLAVTIFFRCVRAIVQPYSLYVQQAVKHCLLSLITMDAIITFAQRDLSWAILILALIVPMTFLGRWSYST